MHAKVIKSRLLLVRYVVSNLKLSILICHCLFYNGLTKIVKFETKVRVFSVMRKSWNFEVFSGIDCGNRGLLWGRLWSKRASQGELISRQFVIACTPHFNVRDRLCQ